MNKIRKGDEVVVIAGKDNGRRGTVLRVYPDERVLVEGVNVAKKPQRPSPNAGVPGGIVDREIVSDQPVRVRYSLTERGRALEPVVSAVLTWGATHGTAEGSE